MKVKKLSGPNIKNFYKIQQIKLKDEHIFSIKITKKMHNEFAKYSGDFSPIHTDLKFCKKNGYMQKIGYAFLLTSILSNVYGMFFPGGSELCLKQVCNFRNPFFVGDNLKIYVKVIQKNENAKLITVSTSISNSKNRIIFEGESIFQLRFNSENRIGFKI